MFHVKLVARPDARMVEVPLEIEVELPREFEGVAQLASSGLPRKVKLKAPRDALKLSTAYRADQLLADIVRTSLRGSPQDVARVQDAARSFIKTVRERRRDGATLLVQSNGRGKIDVVSEPIPQGPPASAGSSAPAVSGAPAGPAGEVPAGGASTLADRVLALERRLAQLESGFAKLIGEGQPGMPYSPSASSSDGLPPLSQAAQVAELPTPGGEPLGFGGGRTTLRRGTAIDAFAEGIRGELRGRATQLLGGADLAAAACDRAARLAAEAIRDLGAPADSAEQTTLRKLAAEAAARQRALQRIAAEIDLYAAAELPIAERLVERLAAGAAAPGQIAPNPAATLTALGESLLRDGSGAQLLGVWIEKAAASCDWTLFEPRPGERFETELHDAPGGREHEGALIARVLVPGVRRSDGTLVARARVAIAESSEPAVAAPGPAREVTLSAEVAAVVETADESWAMIARGPLAFEEAAEFAVSDSDVEEVEELAERASEPTPDEPVKQPAPKEDAGTQAAAPASPALDGAS